MTPAEKAALLECLVRLHAANIHTVSTLRESCPGYDASLDDVVYELEEAQKEIDRLRTLFTP